MNHTFLTTVTAIAELEDEDGNPRDQVAVTLEGEFGNATFNIDALIAATTYPLDTKIIVSVEMPDA